MKRLRDSALHSFAVPLVLAKRYFDAKKEIRKIRHIDSTLLEKHIANARLLTNRDTLLSQMVHGGDVAEIGVAHGDFSVKIMEICAPNTLHLIDIWKEGGAAQGISPVNVVRRIFSINFGSWAHINERFGCQIQSGNTRLHRGLSWEELDGFPDYSLDWVYIDAAHDFDSVLRDLAVAKTKVKRGGIIAGHDYVRWGRFGYKCGVVDAVNSFCIKNNYELIYLTIESRTNASFAIREM